MKSTNIGSRLREIRETLGMSRKEFEALNSQSISGQALANIENNATSVSIGRLTEITDIYKQQGIYFDYQWLITGIGIKPIKLDNSHHKQNDNVNLTAPLELDYFMSFSNDRFVTTVLSDAMQPIYNIGDLVGGVAIDICNVNENKTYIILTTDEQKILCRCSEFKNDSTHLIICSDMRSKTINILNAEGIKKIFVVIMHRSYY